uniref:Nuclear receptor interacting protein 2 n=1 Tax=Gopherus evgoodei TaxID=1825980 RepID=A0A8C4VKW4_9SAUR
MRETCTQEVGPGDREEKRSEGTQNSDRRQHEVELRDKAILQQKRRLKQATQFVHKDSADLLPLDGLKRLGTSKDLQPHSVVQRRLLEGNLNKLRGESREYTTWVQSPLVKDKDDRAEENDRRKETVSLLIHCKVRTSASIQCHFYTDISDRKYSLGLICSTPREPMPEW